MWFCKDTKIGMLQYGIPAIFDYIILEKTYYLRRNNTTIVAPVTNPSSSSSVSVSVSVEIATDRLSSPVTSTFGSSQANSSEYISFEDHH